MKRRMKQAGYSLLSLLATVAATSIIAVGAARTTLATSEKAMGIGAGSALETVNQALSQYMFTYQQALLAGTAVTSGSTTVVIARQPTIPELQALVGLNANYTQTAPNGGNYVINIVNVPSGCVGLSCNMQGTVYVNRAFTSTTGTFPLNAMQGVMQVTAGDVGFSAPDNASTITGPNWTQPNPLGATSGVLMAVTGTGSSIYAQFVRLNDTRDPALRGGLSVQGNVTSTANLTAGGNVVATGALQGASVTTAGAVQAGSVVATGNVTAANNGVQLWNQPGVGGVVAMMASDGTAINVQNAGLGRMRWVNGAFNQELGSIDASGNLSTIANVRAGTSVIPGWAVETWGCETGAIGKAQYTIADGWAYNGKTLSCVNGIWKSSSGSATPRNFRWYGPYGVGVNGDFAWATICYMGEVGQTNNNSQYWMYPTGGPNANNQYLWHITYGQGDGGAQVQPMCYDM